VIDWVMRAEGVRFRHAVELLRADLPSLAAFPAGKRGRQKEPVAKQSTTPKLPVIAEREASDAVLLHDVVDYYHEALKQSPEALGYLAKRGLRNAEMVERFRLGFANRTLAYRLPQKSRKMGAELRGRLQALGILRESGHEHLNGSIVIPVFDAEGRVTEMYGRKINDHLREGTPMHLYLPGPHRGVWNAEAFKASEEVILCEALIDALTFWCAGYRNVTASYGVEGFTDDHREAFGRHGTKRVYIAYDRDEAGDRAAAKLGAELGAMGIETWRVLFPKGMDANEYALKVGPAEKSLGLVLRNAEWLGKGVAPGRRVLAPAPAVHESATDVVGAAETTVEHSTDDMASDAGDELAEKPASDESSLNDERATVASAAERDEVANVVAPPEGFPLLAAENGKTEAPSPAAAMERREDEVVFHFGDRRWRVRGLEKNASPAALRVNVLVSREGGAFHVDTLELYSARQRGTFVAQAATELGVEERVVKRDLGEVLLRLEELQERALRGDKESGKKRVELTEVERGAALELLRDPRLLDRILGDFEKCGVVGERVNKLVGYLAATSRKLEQPLAVVLQSSSAAGKSSLMDAVLSLMPEEERVSYSAMTGQSLFYMGETDLQHKILAIVEEEGAERASYALKLLQSEGELTIASTGKDPATGRLITHEYRVTGPVMIFLTTTAIEVDEELLNRCLVLSVDEGREQTRAIHERQREAQTLEGLLARADRQRILKVHQDAQRLLRPLLVANPFARKLGFLDTQTRARRDHMKYLTLIRAIALLHQYQRRVLTAEHGGQAVRYIEVTKEDIAIANRLSAEVLGRTLDELPPQTRGLLGLLDRMVTAGSEKLGMDRADFRFSRREVREATGWGTTQLRVHLGRLTELEYVMPHRGARGQSYVYELCYAGEGTDGAPFLPGLIEASALGGDASTTSSWRGSGGELAGSWRGQNGGMAGGSRGATTEPNERQKSSERDRSVVERENARPGTARAALPTAVRRSSSNGAAVAARG
jgi:DNA primase